MHVSLLRFKNLIFVLITLNIFSSYSFASDSSRVVEKTRKTHLRESPDNADSRQKRDQEKLIRQERKMGRCLIAINMGSGLVVPVVRATYSQVDRDRADQEVNELTDRINFELRSQNVEEAIRLTENAIKDWPRKIRFKLLLARSYLQKGDLDSANQQIYEFEKDYIGFRIQNANLLSHVYFLKYVIALEKGDARLAHGWYSQAIIYFESERFKGEAKAIQASIQYHKGNLSLAVDTLITSFNHFNSNIFAIKLREILLKKFREKYRELMANHSFSESLDVLDLLEALLNDGSPRDKAQALLQRSKTYFEIGKSLEDKELAGKSFQESHRLINQSIELNPNDEPALLLASLVNLKLNNYKEAEEILNRLEQMGSEDDLLLGHKARAVYGQGKTLEAIMFIEKQVKTYEFHESYVWIYSFYLSLNREVGKLDAAKSFLRTNFPNHYGSIISKWEEAN